VTSSADKIQRAGIRPWQVITAALLAGNCLLLAAPPGPARTSGALITLVLPGLALAGLLLSGSTPLLRWTVGAGLGYAFVVGAGLALTYLPGPIHLWSILALADGLTLALVAALHRSPKRSAVAGGDGSRLIPLLIVLLLAGFFRLGSLGYSEFQGDEIKAMIPAARALEGHAEALIEGRKKGPAEVLIPMLPWRLTRTTEEAGARLPFALAGLGTIATLFLLGRKLGGDQAGVAAAGVATLNGLLIAFSRIVQYQAIVLWMSALAVLCAWEWRDRKQTRWAVLAGVFAGVGLLAHYDALAIVPVLAYIAFLVFLQARADGRQREWRRDVLLGLLCTTLIAGAFYGPYLLVGQVGATASYLGERIGGGLLKNRTDNFLAYGIFCNSFLYLALTGGLVLGFIAWQVGRAPALRRIPGARIWAPGLIVFAGVALMVWPDSLGFAALDLAPLAWLLIFFAAILAASSSPAVQGALIWLAATFLISNFLLADPRTHIYGIFLPWSLIAGAALAALWGAWAQDRWQWVGIALAAGAIACLCPFLFDSYLRHDAAGNEDRPAVLRALAWAPKPYATPPTQGLFGRVHRSGWKGIGALYAEGRLSGDIDSNEKTELTDWYVPTAYRIARSDPDPCGRLPRYLFEADDLVAKSGVWPKGPPDLDQYAEVGRVELPNGNGVTIYEVNPTKSGIGRVDALALSRRFDARATPALFSEGPQPGHRVLANLGGLIQLTGCEAWQAGESIAVTLFWEAIEAPGEDYQVFVHIEGGQEGAGPAGVWGQSDGSPACGLRPTGAWLPGDRVADRRIITPAPEAPAGSYSLVAGLYRLDTGQRLPVLDEAGHPIGDSVALETVDLPPPNEAGRDLTSAAAYASEPAPASTTRASSASAPWPVANTASGLTSISAISGQSAARRPMRTMASTSAAPSAGGAPRSPASSRAALTSPIISSASARASGARRKLTSLRAST
jgi:4-amino-4-deoxy-L-arabinose transferase-like glycosyltransferase